ncbi:MAG: hypothetical protein F6K24_03630 [Okeania sp. SIO2D1]|nr:hypothetical protein [Okeania sp. SIO2D1]
MPMQGEHPFVADFFGSFTECRLIIHPYIRCKTRIALTYLTVVWDLGNAEVFRILWNQAIATVKE